MDFDEFATLLEEKKMRHVQILNSSDGGHYTYSYHEDLFVMDDKYYIFRREINNKTNFITKQVTDIYSTWLLEAEKDEYYDGDLDESWYGSKLLCYNHRTYERSPLPKATV